MITMHPRLVPIHIPGYFWHLDERVLYSIKIAGQLRKLTLRSENGFSKMRFLGSYYILSLNSRKKYLPINRLKRKYTKEIDFELPLKE